MAHPGLNRLRWIDGLDPGTLAKGAIASAGIAECDPLADRELIEFSLTMPFEACLDNGIYRPLARQALVNRVPATVLNSPLRGLQAADWHHRFRQQTAIDILEEIQAGPAFDILDPIKLRMAIERWPQSPDYDFGTADLYARRIPIALGLGLFINEFSRGR